MEHSIGKIIAHLRKEKGWTQLELAEKLKVSDKTISKWECDGGIPETLQLPCISQLFDVSVDYLLTGKEPKPIVMSKIEFCAKYDDVELFQQLPFVKKDIDRFDVKKRQRFTVCDYDYNIKDEDGKFLTDYIVQYNSEKVFIAFCEKDKDNISKFDILPALRFCLTLNRLDLFKGVFIEAPTNGFVYGGTLYDKDYNIFVIDDVFVLSPKNDENNYFGNGYGFQETCLLTDDIFKLIITDKRINKTTLAKVFGNREGFNYVWYQVYPYLIHQAYINNKNEILIELLNKLEESNERGFSKYINDYGKWCSYSHYFYFISNGKEQHGFVRILKETFMLALEKGDFDLVERFNNINRNINKKYSFGAYLCENDEIRVAKLKVDKKASKDEVAIQSCIHNNILDIEELLAINNYKVIETALKNYSISNVETIAKSFMKNGIKGVFEWAVDNDRDSLSDFCKAYISAIDERKREYFRQEIFKIIESIHEEKTKNDNYLYEDKSQENRYHLNKRKEFDFKIYSKEMDMQFIATHFENIKNRILNEIHDKIDKQGIIETLNKEFFDSEIEKGNIDIVIIKLCVRLEAFLKYNYCNNYDNKQTFEEMLKVFCDDHSNDEICELLQKLRKQRNKIVHAEKTKENMKLEEIKECINYICNLGE